MGQSASSHCFTNNYSFTIGALPFRGVQGQSALFLDYLEKPASLTRYYPESVASHTEISSRIPAVLSNHRVDREALCDALADMNRDSGQHVEANIELLRDADCVAVVSGQQAGLFSGPLFTIYKALSAVRLTKCLRDRGFKAVPVFWIATEDHDFEEVAKTFLPDRDGRLRGIHYRSTDAVERTPVGNVVVEDSIVGLIEEFFAAMPQTEHTSELRRNLEDAWKPGECFGNSFAKFLRYLLKDFGLILLCPLDPRLKRLAAPIYVDAVRKSDEIVAALRERSAGLERDGYHAQVHVGEDYFPLFWQDDKGARTGLKRTAEGRVSTKDGSHEFSLEELESMIVSDPSRFSPSVVLRSVVQDYLLPTVAYFGGAAEVAYFAQSGEVYRVLGRPVTPIFHRQSFTVVEPKHRKVLEKYGLGLEGLFRGIENVVPGVVEAHLNQEAGAVFGDVEARFNEELDRLATAVAEVDKTLEDNLIKRRRKILYHVEALRHKFHAAQMRKDAAVRVQLETMFDALLPNRHLQERSLNVCYFVNRYGIGFIDWIYEAVDLDDPDHRILYL